MRVCVGLILCLTSFGGYVLYAKSHFSPEDRWPAFIGMIASVMLGTALMVFGNEKPQDKTP